MAISNDHEKIKLLQKIVEGLDGKPAYLLIFGVMVPPFFIITIGAVQKSPMILYVGLIFWQFQYLQQR